MTTFAYRAGVLAADTGVSLDGLHVGHTSKIARNDKGDLAACAGTAAFLRAFRKWFLDGEQGDAPTASKEDNDYGAIYRRYGLIETYSCGGWTAYRAEYHAAGSGSEMALGAMAEGASARNAVKAAMKHDPGTFGEIEALAHE